jgi:hypothetical protein
MRARLPILALEVVQQLLADEGHRQELDSVDSVVEVLQRALLIELAHLVEVLVCEAIHWK